MRGFAFAIAILCCASAAQAKRVYSGDEAAALRCANALALTAVALGRTGQLSKVESDVMLGVSVMMLDRHVSGTWPQKRAALKVMKARRSVVDTLDDFQRNSQSCLRRFPIN